MNKFVQIFVSFTMLLGSSCTNDFKKEYPEILKTILKQYPMYVKISPDARKVLVKNRGKKTFDLLVSNLKTSEIDTIDTSNFTQLSLTWHPSGEEIVFQEFNPRRKSYNLYKINLDNKKRDLIKLPTSKNAIPPLRWSNNGEHLAYLATSGISTLYVYDYTQRRIIKRIQGLDPYSDFQWSGNSTVFYIENPKNPRIKKIDLNTGQITEYTLLEEGELGNFYIKGDSILFSGRSDADEYYQCYEFSLKTGFLKKMTTGNNNVTNCRYSKNKSMFFFNQNESGVDRLYCSDSLINKYLKVQTQGSVKVDLELDNDFFQIKTKIIPQGR